MYVLSLIHICIGTAQRLSHGGYQLAIQALGGEVITLTHISVVMYFTHSTHFVLWVQNLRRLQRGWFLPIIPLTHVLQMDVLLGADLVSAVLKGQVVPLGSGRPTSVGTNFGFVIMGSAFTSHYFLSWNVR